MSTQQFASFWVGGRLFGIDVQEVQEVTKPLPITPLRTAPSHILGLVNLRGQLSTAIGLSEFFKIEQSSPRDERMAVVCQAEGGMVSLLVDQIGDVLELDESARTEAPGHIQPHVRRLIGGVYQLEGNLLSILNVNRILTNITDK